MTKFSLNVTTLSIISHSIVCLNAPKTLRSECDGILLYYFGTLWYLAPSGNVHDWCVIQMVTRLPRKGDSTLEDT